ncbi:MAG TPA: DUF302 domain-containing protein [Thermoflexales bacterium]|nr:DUF302 domain-containing protein [Thermoflexales bacterium]HQW34218.1 DUF302 domain-containing protein [Thermoflexales bacterium]HQZ20663.1 DUF302 domain-containing protein [Thermoflexales bacterium]
MQKPTLGANIALNTSYEVAVEKAKAALKTEGFGVLTEIDVKATMKQKLNADFRRYVILGACNPPLAHQALSADLEVGLLLPCNVCVYEKDDGSSVVSIISPQGMAAMLNNPAFDAIAAEAQAKLDRVAQALGG